MKKILLLLALLSGCTTTPPIDPSSLTPKSATERDGYFKNFQSASHWGQGVLTSIDTKEPSRLAHTAQNAGRSFSFVVTVRALHTSANWYPKNPIKLPDPQPLLSKKIAKREANQTDILNYATAISLMTFCRGGSVTKNTTAGFSYSSPEAIAAIFAANNGAIIRNGIIPKGLKKTPLPVIESRHKGIYTIRLRCSLWRM